MAERMPPPGGHGGLAVIITPKDQGSDNVSQSNGRTPPPGSPKPSGPDEQGKIQPGPTDIVRADAHCIDCKWYGVDDGTCQKWQGQFGPQDGCGKYFDPVGDEDEPDADDQGGVSDNDADDQSIQGNGGPPPMRNQ